MLGFFLEEPAALLGDRTFHLPPKSRLRPRESARCAGASERCYQPGTTLARACSAKSALNGLAHARFLARARLSSIERRRGTVQNLRQRLARQLTTVIFAKLHQGRPHRRLAVIGISPRPWLELSRPKEQSYFGKDPLPQINAMGLVFRGRQHELAQG